MKNLGKSVYCTRCIFQTHSNDAAEIFECFSQETVYEHANIGGWRNQNNNNERSMIEQVNQVHVAEFNLYLINI